MPGRARLTRRGFVKTATAAGAAVVAGALETPLAWADASGGATRVGDRDVIKGRLSAFPLQAAMYGPLVLAGRLGNQGLTREMVFPAVPWELPGKPATAPDIAADPKDGASWVEAVPGERLSFRARGQSRPLALAPLYRILNERYAVYWNLRPSTA